MGQACCQEYPKQASDAVRMSKWVAPAQHGSSIHSNQEESAGQQSLFCDPLSPLPKLQDYSKLESQGEYLRATSGLVEPLETHRKCSVMEKHTLSTISMLGSGSPIRLGAAESRLFTDMDTVDSPEPKRHRLSDNRKHSLQLKHYPQDQDDQLSCLSEGHDSILSKQVNFTLEVELPEPKKLEEVSGSCTPLSHHSDLGDIPELVHNLPPTRLSMVRLHMEQRSGLSSAHSSFEEYQGIEITDPLKELKQKCFGDLLTTKDVVKWVLITQGISQCHPEVTKGIYGFVYHYHGMHCQKPGFWSEKEFRYFLMEANQQGVLTDSVSLLDS